MAMNAARTVTGRTPLRLQIAAEVRAWRSRRSMSQKELGLALGLSQTQISARLRGEVAITLDEIERLADIFGVSAQTLLTGALANDEKPQQGGELSPIGALTREVPRAEFRCTPPSSQRNRRRRVHRRTPDIAPIVPLRCAA